MTQSGQPQRTSLRRVVAVPAVVVPLALGLTGCSAITKAVNAVKTVHDVLHGSAAINQLSSKISAGDSGPYDVSYVTTGSAPATINYAADPPTDFAFDDTTASGELRVFAGSAGQFECNRSGTARWACDKTDYAGVNTSKMAYALYSGAYWIDFLKIYSVWAALHKVTVSQATMTVNGFKLECAVVVSGTKPNQSTSEVCVTSQGILGYVSVAAKSADFEIKSYSPSPPASLFQVPSGATVTVITTTTTS